MDVPRRRHGSSRRPRRPATCSASPSTTSRPSPQSGAGGDKDTLSVAGSVAINIVSNDTEAVVPAGATVSAGTGDVTLKTLSNEEDAAKADSDAKSGKVGIGASVSVQVLNDNTVRSAIEDGATVLRRRRADHLGHAAPHRRDRGQGRLRGRHARAQPVRLDRDRHRRRLRAPRHRRGAHRHRRGIDHRLRGSGLEPRLERLGRRQQRRHRRRGRGQRGRDERDRRSDAQPHRGLAHHRRDHHADDRREVGGELEGRVRTPARAPTTSPTTRSRTTRTRRARPTARCRRRATRPARATASRAARAATATAAASTSRPPSPSTGRAARTSPRSRRT